MTEPAFLTTTRAAYDTVAVDYARLVGTEVTAGVERPQEDLSSEMVTIARRAHPALRFEEGSRGAARQLPAVA